MPIVQCNITMNGHESQPISKSAFFADNSTKPCLQLAKIRSTLSCLQANDSLLGADAMLPDFIESVSVARFCTTALALTWASTAINFYIVTNKVRSKLR